ncbi:MAG: hypothetical protein IJO52_08655 [Clostridia bacterium]|nr:hypothetical protein [Clostridia bacterium]
MKNLKNAVFCTTACFTAVTYLVMAIMRLIDSGMYLLNFANLTRILIFSASVGICGLIFSLKLPRAVARSIHFVIVCLDFALVIATVPYGSDFRMIFPATLAFMAVYWAVVGIGALCRSALSGRKEDKE